MCLCWAGESEEGNELIICCGPEKGSTHHTMPAIAWHASCLPVEELEVPLQEILDSPETHSWACRTCAVELAGAGTFIDWKVIERSTKRVNLGNRKRGKRLVYKVQWLGEQGTTEELHSGMTGTQSLRWYRDMLAPSSDSE